MFVLLTTIKKSKWSLSNKSKHCITKNHQLGQLNFEIRGSSNFKFNFTALKYYYHKPALI